VAYNGTHTTWILESTRFDDKQLLDLWNAPTPGGNSAYGPFTSEEFVNALQHLKLGTSPR